ncbi:MAG: hypothetical protein OEW97_01260 [Gammaproteobacteria bacterium]|nr:hypothetical protein [Gammaproteobacteria bacterium]
MKWIIYFLLIINIGFAAWHFRGVNFQGSDNSEAIDVSNENQLILLSEFRQQEQNKISGNGQLCFSLGPFTKETEANSAQTAIKIKNVETTRIRLRDTSLSGYWVILPAAESRQAALKQVAQLKKHKITDYFLVATGAYENAVSLGVYSQKNLARRRVDEIIRLGFVPRMESVALPRKVYWLNWYKNSKAQLPEPFIEELKKQYPQLVKVERSCK